MARMVNMPSSQKQGHSNRKKTSSNAKNPCVQIESWLRLLRASKTMAGAPAVWRGVGLSVAERLDEGVIERAEGVIVCGPAGGRTQSVH